MTILVIFSGIAFAVATMVGIFAHSRGGAIWFTWAGVVLAITAAFVWFQGTVLEHDNILPPPTPSLLPAIVPPTKLAPIIPSVRPSPSATIPTPESVSPKPTPIFSPSSSDTKLTPQQIFQKIDSASVYNRQNVRNAFVGLSVDWTLSFVSASPSGEDMLIFLRDQDNDNWGKMVMCSVPLKGNERFPLMSETDRFRVRGVIKEAGILSINLWDVSIEQIHD